jgi:hypothetical protein
MSNEAKSRKFVVREEVEPVDDDGIASSSSDHSSDSAPTTTTKVIGPTNPDRAQSSHSRGAGCDSSNETKGWNDGHESRRVRCRRRVATLGQHNGHSSIRLSSGSGPVRADRQFQRTKQARRGRNRPKVVAFGALCGPRRDCQQYDTATTATTTITTNAVAAVCRHPPSALWLLLMNTAEIATAITVTV